MRWKGSQAGLCTQHAGARERPREGRRRPRAFASGVPGACKGSGIPLMLALDAGISRSVLGRGSPSRMFAVAVKISPRHRERSAIRGDALAELLRRESARAPPAAGAASGLVADRARTPLWWLSRRRHGASRRRHRPQRRAAYVPDSGSRAGEAGQMAEFAVGLAVLDVAAPEHRRPAAHVVAAALSEQRRRGRSSLLATGVDGLHPRRRACTARST